MKIEEIEISKLIPADYNPRKISEGMLQKLADGIKEFGIVQPILCNKNTGNIVGGHQRVKAAKLAGIDAVPVAWVELSEGREKALNLAMNKVNGEWDDDLLAELLADMDEEDLDLSGFDADEMKDILGDVDSIELPVLPDGYKDSFQQMTFTLHDDQAVQVECAIKASKSLGPFDSPNENGNGNALARICETFNTEHGNA